MFAPPPDLRKHRNLIIPAAIGLAVILAALAARNLMSAPSGQVQRPAERSQPAAVVQTTPARTAPIRSVFSYAGSVTATQQVNLVPRTSGIVQTIPVEVGTIVRRGDTLATLDPGTLPDQLFQARAGLDATQAKLAQVVAGGRTEEIAAARAQLDQARSRLEGMLQGRPEDVQVARAGLDAQQAKLELMEAGGRPEAVAQAQASLDAARAKLALVQRGATADIRQAAVSAVEASRAAVASAQAALANQAGTSEADVRAAQSAVDTSRAALVTAESALANLGYSYASDLWTAQGAADTARSNLESAQARLRQTRTGPTSMEVAAAESAVASARSTLTSARLTLTAAQACFSNPSSSDCASLSSGRSGSTPVVPSQARIQADQAGVDSAEASLRLAETRLAQLRQGPNPSDVAAAETAVGTAQANYTSAQARLELVKNEGRDSRGARLRSQLEAAREKLAADQTRLAALLSGGLAAQRLEAENRLVAAQEKLKSDEARLAQIVAGAQDEELQQAEAAVREADQRLALAIMPATEQDLRAQRAAVEQARLQLEKAQRPASAFEIQQQEQVVAQMEAQYQGRVNPYNAIDLQAARAAVDQAEGQVAVARTNLEQTVLAAPFDGVVGQRLLAVGAFASPQTPILAVVGRAVEIHVTVEEARIGLVAPGQRVTFTVPAYPGVAFTGSVLTISPSGDPRAHTFDVTILPTEQDPRLLTGMYAQVELLAAEKSTAVVVPREVVVQSADGAVVFVVVDGRAQARRVELGLADDKNVEIARGVEVQEPVVTVGQNLLKDGQPVQVAGARRPGAEGQERRPGERQQ